ncbi:MAG: DUF1801 domain-containing protein [Myxococcales bacterium]
MKMKKYPSFEEFYRDQTPKARAVLRALRSFVKTAAPRLVESVKWGNGCWLLDEAPVCFAHIEPDHVQFGFFHGARLEDPTALPQGPAQYVRHIKLRKPADLQAAAFKALLKQAIAKP